MAVDPLSLGITAITVVGTNLTTALGIIKYMAKQQKPNGGNGNGSNGSGFGKIALPGACPAHSEMVEQVTKGNSKSEENGRLLSIIIDDFKYIKARIDQIADRTHGTV